MSLISLEVTAQIRHKGLPSNSYVVSEGTIESVYFGFIKMLGDIATITLSSFSFNGHNIDIIIDYN